MRLPESRGLRLLIEVSRHSIRKYLKHDDMPSYAAALAYRALFALFPFLALLVSLLTFLGAFGFFDWLIEQAYAALPEQYASLWEEVIERVQNQTQGELLLVTIGIALWSVSSGVRTLTKALNAVHDVEETRPGWQRYVLSFFYALGLAIMVILAMGLMLIGPSAVEWIAGLVGLDEVFVSLWTRLRLPVALVLMMLSVSIVYWALPNVNHPYRLITPGAALSIIFWVLASLGFSFYLANFANYSVVYGSLGVAFALLLYFYISATVLLMGAELNAAIYYYASDRNTQEEEEEEEERRTGHETPDAETRSRSDA
jgi:membrane protein